MGKDDIHRTTKEVSGCFWLFRLSDLSDSAVLVETVQWCRSCCPGVHFLKSCLHENYVKYSYISMVFSFTSRILHHIFLRSCNVQNNFAKLTPSDPIRTPCESNRSMSVNRIPSPSKRNWRSQRIHSFWVKYNRTPECLLYFYEYRFRLKVFNQFLRHFWPVMIIGLQHDVAQCCQFSCLRMVFKSPFLPWSSHGQCNVILPIQVTLTIS